MTLVGLGIRTGGVQPAPASDQNFSFARLKITLGADDCVTGTALNVASKGLCIVTYLVTEAWGACLVSCDYCCLEHIAQERITSLDGLLHLPHLVCWQRAS